MEADFSGYATKAGLKCSDGRTIMPEAFKNMDGQKVPLVWQHGHSEPSNVLGHAMLESRDDGVYAYAFFNETDPAKQAKTLVQHGDITALSIYANQLVERSKQVFHGVIRELSLVLSGANPGALIDNVTIAHADGDIDTLEDEAIIYTGLPIDLDTEVKHTDEPVTEPVVEHVDTPADPTVQEVYDTLTQQQKDVVDYMLGMAIQEATNSVVVDPAIVDPAIAQSEAVVQHAGSPIVMANFAMINAERKGDTQAMISAGKAMIAANKNGDTKPMEDAIKSGDVKAISTAAKALMSANKVSAVHSDNTDTNNDEGDLTSKEGTAEMAHKEGTDDMTHNVFEQSGIVKPTGGPTLTHDQLKVIVDDAQRIGSLKESFLAHAVEYGIENIDYLFPDAQSVTSQPDVISRRMEWVQSVIGGAKHSPFARIKSTAVDITAEEARAKGYVKATLKKEEVIKLLKRVTTPTTVYKKQKLDRDDIIDITDLDVVAWLKAEMRVMLDEELARAVLIGDGRDPEAEDKIDEVCLRPIAYDDEMYSHLVTVASNITGDAIVEAILRARTYYKGTGTPTLYTTDSILTDMILLKDGMGRRLYATEVELAAALRPTRRPGGQLDGVETAGARAAAISARSELGDRAARS